MTYRLLYHPQVVEKDLPSINRNLQERIRHAIEKRLTTEPTYYGEPLRHRLKGYWKLRVGDYRVIYTIAGQQVLIAAIGHRKEIYAAPPQRLLWKAQPG